MSSLRGHIGDQQIHFTRLGFQLSNARPGSCHRAAVVFRPHVHDVGQPGATQLAADDKRLLHAARFQNLRSAPFVVRADAVEMLLNRGTLLLEAINRDWSL
jgi:hypothetical protein